MVSRYLIMLMYCAKLNVACDNKNSEGRIRGPVFSILFDGSSFRFFNAETIPFRMGVLNGTYDFTLSDWETNPEQFIRDLHRICEITFWLLLCAYHRTLIALSDTDDLHKDAWADTATNVGLVLQQCVLAGTQSEYEGERTAIEALNHLSSR